MGSEMLLYGYGLVCMSMLAFNIVYLFGLKKKNTRLEKSQDRFATKVNCQLERMQNGQPVENRHMSYLRRRLTHVGNLIAFDKLLTERLEGKHNAAASEYLRQIQPLILYLAVVYRDRSDMQAAFYCYFLSKHREKRHMAVDTVQDILVGFMDKESLYCRVNALQALYRFGDPEHIAAAVSLLDQKGRFFHEKLLTDGLLTFTGDHGRLIALLLEQFDGFSNLTKLAILNYIRFQSGDYCPWMMGILEDSGSDKELRLAAVRYFGRYVYEPAKPALIALTVDKDPLRWEYASVAASSLAGYKGDDVVDALMAAVYSSNWYVRGNAAASLDAHHLSYVDLAEIMGGNDRYVREMMMYYLELRSITQESREATS